MKTLKEYKEQQMQNLEFVKEYEAIQLEMDAIRNYIDRKREDRKNELQF